MSEAKFKTLRHIETVRNYLNLCIRELLERQEKHDQSKLESPECEMFEVFTHRLRSMTYGSQEYKDCLTEMGDALKHHYKNNRHHPEHFQGGICEMTLIDLLEMLCDWKASGMRHDDGDIMKSIEINRQRFNLTTQVTLILENTAKWMNEKEVFHKAKES